MGGVWGREEEGTERRRRRRRKNGLRMTDGKGGIWEEKKLWDEEKELRIKEGGDREINEGDMEGKERERGSY